MQQSKKGPELKLEVRIVYDSKNDEFENASGGGNQDWRLLKEQVGRNLLGRAEEAESQEKGDEGGQGGDDEDSISSLDGDSNDDGIAAIDLVLAAGDDLVDSISG